MLVLILLVALAARVGVVVATPDYRPIFDAAHYDRLGASIASGDGYPGQLQPPTPSAFRPPLYPLALAAVHVVGGGWTAGRLLGALFGVATVLLVVLIADRLWDRRVALIAGALAAVFPPLVVLDASLLSETLFVPLVLAVLLALLEFRQTAGRRWLVTAGVLGGLAALTRVNGLALVLAAGLGTWTRRPRWSRAALAPALAIAMAAALTAAPWVVRNTIAFGRFVGISTQGGYALAATYNAESARLHPPGRPVQTGDNKAFRELFRDPGLDEGERSSRLTYRALDYAADHPGYVAGALLWNTLRVFDLHHDEPYKIGFQANFLQGLGLQRLASPLIPVTVYVLLALALLGAAIGARRVPAVVWVFPLLLIVPAIAAYGLARYRAPIDPFLVMLAALGIGQIFPESRIRAARY